MSKKKDEQVAIRLRERKKEDRVPKNVLSLPMITGLNVSDEGEWVHFCLPPKLG